MCELVHEFGVDILWMIYVDDILWMIYVWLISVDDISACYVWMISVG